MKQVIKRTSIIAMALMAVFTVASVTASANDSSHVIPVELKFVGEQQNRLVFQLNFDGTADENEFTVAIIDESGLTVYKEVIKGEKITKKFLLNADDFGNTSLKFQITSKKTNQTVVYQVDHVARYVEDVVVNKLK